MNQKLHELKIEDVAFGGNGVARADGKAVFVPFTIDGERVAARIVREKKNFAEAELQELLDPSAHRVTPECPYFGRCGGCSYQHIHYEHQLELKARQVEQTLRRIGHLSELPMQPIVPSPKSYEYRNRITVHCEEGVIGFYRRDEHRLIDIEQCPIAMPDLNEELKDLRAGNPRDGHYTLRTDSGPRIFSQTNDAVAEQLLKRVTDLIPEHSDLLIDAYCGAGFFAKHLLDKFDRIIGIDWDAHAIAAAHENFTAKETYIAGNIDELLHEQLQTGNRTSTIVIVDPPATGLGAAVRSALLQFPPANLIYVSCNPATLARDLAALIGHFTIDSITPMDMFPQTAEIEVAVKLTARLS